MCASAAATPNAASRSPGATRSGAPKRADRRCADGGWRCASGRLGRWRETPDGTVWHFELPADLAGLGPCCQARSSAFRRKAAGLIARQACRLWWPCRQARSSASRWKIAGRRRWCRESPCAAEPLEPGSATATAPRTATQNQARCEYANTCSEAQMRQNHDLVPGPKDRSSAVERCNIVAWFDHRVYGNRKLNTFAKPSGSKPHSYDALMSNPQAQAALAMPALSGDARGEASR